MQIEMQASLDLAFFAMLTETAQLIDLMLSKVWFFVNFRKTTSDSCLYRTAFAAAIAMDEGQSMPSWSKPFISYRQKRIRGWLKERSTKF